MIIAIEGGDKAGKYTQAGLLQHALRKRNIQAITFEFPNYETRSGKTIRMYLNGEYEIPPESAYRLFEENMYADIDEVNQAIKNYDVVIMNRYYHSNMIYGRVNGLSGEWIRANPSHMPKPDMVILLDISYEESYNRQGANRDRYEKNANYFRRVVNLYRNTARREGWKVYGWALTAGEIHERILADVLKAMGK